MTSRLPELQLKRFLHYGKVTPLYQSGKRFNFDFEENSVKNISALLVNNKEIDAVKYVLRAYSNGYSAYPQSLVFALALCIRKSTSENIRQDAYNAVKIVCKSPEDFFSFIKFAHDLAIPNSGWGHGMRRVVSEWYLSNSAMELADCVTKYRGRHGWSHADVIKLAHLKSSNVAKSAVLKYVICGLNEAKMEFGKQPEAQQVLKFLQTIEDFKQCVDVRHAARLIDIHSLSLEHVPAQLITSKEVWNALIPHLPLEVILKNMKRLGKLQLLNGNEPIVIKIVEALNNQTAIVESNLNPAQVFIDLCKYQNIANSEPQQAAVPLEPNHIIVKALGRLMTSTFRMLAPTGLRYLVAIDARKQMVYNKCYNCKSVTSASAAALITLCLVKAERNVTVVAFSTEGDLQPVPIDKNTTLEEAQNKLKEIPKGPVDLTQPLFWAEDLDKVVDVFIILTDRHVKQGKVKAVVALRRYRNVFNIPNCKMIVCGLSLETFSVACPEDRGMLDVAGFDGQVPRVIEAFCRGAF